MRFKDIDGKDFDVRLSGKLYLTIKGYADDGRIILDRRRAQKVSEYFARFAATGRLTRQSANPPDNRRTRAHKKAGGQERGK